jgi:hypothetical protein
MNKETEIKSKKHFPLIDLEPVCQNDFMNNLCNDNL